MISRIIASAAAGTLTASYSMGNVTHLLVGTAVPVLDADKVQVLLTSPHHEPVVLVNRVSMLALQGISDFKYGTSQTLQAAIAGVTTTDYVGYFFVVDVGCLNLRATNSQIQVTIDWSQTAALSVAVLNLEEGVDHMVKTLETAQLTADLEDAMAVYIYFATGSKAPWTDAALNDVTIQVESPRGPGVCTIQDAIGFTAVMGEIEAYAPENVYCIYASQDDVPDAVHVALSGSDADSDLKLILQSLTYKTKRVAMATEQLVAKKTRQLEQKSPGKRTVLAEAGVVAPFEALKAVAPTLAARAQKSRKMVG